VEVGGKAVEGGYFSNHYSVDDPNPEVQKFVSAYEKEYGKKPGAMAALGYDAARVLADAIKRAGKLDKAAIRDALAKTQDFPGITGSITMDANRDCIKPAVILQVKDGKWKYVTTIKP
jgi:branched-chain amino acid transport system substrate-binding protein